MLLIIDNYDSFTYNLFQAFATLTEKIAVIRNDALSVREVEEMSPAAIVLSPGPGMPQQTGICIELVQNLAPQVPILGICLGHQAIAAAYGGSIVHAREVVHGKTAKVFHRRQGVLHGMPLPFTAGRYHSLIVERETLPDSLLIEADDAAGTIMAIRHAQHRCYGLQFHPESILTPQGGKIFRTFLEIAGIAKRQEEIVC